MESAQAHLSTAPLITLSAEGRRADVQVFGAPFDATSTYRTGSRFGPDAIRSAFWNIEVYSRALDLDLEELSIEDLGNLQHTARVDRVQEAVRATVAASVAAGYVPAMLGGEHSLSFASISAMPANTVLLVVDAHLDLRDEYDDLTLMHATYLRRLVEQRPGLRVVHVGTRAATRAEWDFAEANNVTLITAETVLAGPTEERQARETVANTLAGAESVYVSIDLDGLDPAYAPGVANPEAGGLSTRQALDFLYLLRGLPISGFDIVELCPQYDPGGITAVAAARFLAALCGLVHLNRNASPTAGQ